jgi:hypothetical protein
MKIALAQTTRLDLAVHPDYLQPHVDTITFKLPRPMAAAIRGRSLATGQGIGFIVRDCIRRGAPLLDQPLDVTGPELPSERQEAVK